MPSEKDLFYEAAMDNISTLYQSFVELMLNQASCSQFLKKLLKSEVDLNLKI